MNGAHLYEQLTERKIQRYDAMRCDDVSDSKCKIHSHVDHIRLALSSINETKPSENVATYDWIKIAFSVCKVSIYFCKMNVIYDRKKTRWTWLTWYEYIFTKTELICHPNRRHTFAKLIKNRMKFKMQFTWLHLFLLLNSVFFFFSLIFHERTCIVRIFNVLPTCNCHFQLSFLQISTTNMPNSGL